jgi:hypothetical protein
MTTPLSVVAPVRNASAALGTPRDGHPEIVVAAPATLARLGALLETRPGIELGYRLRALGARIVLARDVIAATAALALVVPSLALMAAAWAVLEQPLGGTSPGRREAA